MTKHVFVTLVRLHPRRFRERFEDELLEAFDLGLSTYGGFRLVVDATRSLIRQWLLRPPMPSSEVRLQVVGPIQESGMFVQVLGYRPSRAAMLGGTLASLTLCFTLQYATNHWTQGLGLFEIGVDNTASEGGITLTVDESAEPDARKEERPEAEVWQDMSERFFAEQKVLRALDTHPDFIISASEISAAPLRLAKLDRNRDGDLDAVECLDKARAEDPIFRQQLLFRQSPVLRALDVNANGRIERVELRGAQQSLKTLDTTGNGSLHAVEFLPRTLVNRMLMPVRPVRSVPSR